LPEGVIERAIQHGYPDVEEGLHGHPVPAHLLRLVHALGYDLTALSTNAVEIGSPRRRRAA